MDNPSTVAEWEEAVKVRLEPGKAYLVDLETDYDPNQVEWWIQGLEIAKLKERGVFNAGHNPF